VLTGWSFDRPDKKKGVDDFRFAFRRRLHDPGEKVVLGERFEWAGEREGERALDLLASHPSTARFVARKLCRRFVSDDPPGALVERVAAAFRRSDGDLAATLRALFEDPAFLAASRFRAKVKTPLEYVASALRATGARVDDPLKLARLLERMGQPLYLCEPPTGYPDTASAWVNAGALMQRIQAALTLFSARPGAPASADAESLLAPEDRADGVRSLRAYVRALLGGEIQEKTFEALERRLADPEISSAARDDKRRYRFERLAALVLGSPDFQRR
jgi:uncharacterized protein (DUF1800 family)